VFNLTAINNNDITEWLAVASRVILNGSNNVPARDNLAEDDVLAIKMGSVVEGQEELRAVGVRARVGHGEVTAGSMLVVKVLVIELFSVSIDALATGAVTIGEVTTLGHEAIDDTVELAALVAEAFTLLASAEYSEVLRGLRSVTIQLHNNSANLTAANCDVEVDIRELLISSRCFFGVHWCLLVALLGYETMTFSKCSEAALIEAAGSEVAGSEAAEAFVAVAIVLAEAATAADATKVKAGLGGLMAEAAAKVKA